MGRIRVRRQTRLALMAAAFVVGALAIADSAQAIQPLYGVVAGSPMNPVFEGRRLGADESTDSVCRKVATAEKKDSLEIVSCDVQAGNSPAEISVNTQYCCKTNSPFQIHFACPANLVPQGANFACVCPSGQKLNGSVCQASCPGAEQNGVCTEKPPAKNNGPWCETCPNRAGTNPVNAGTGTKYQRELLYRAISSAMPLSIEAHYNSYPFAGPIDAPLTSLGRSWTSIASQGLVAVRPGPLRLAAIRADGRQFEFTPPAGGSQVWVPATPDITDRLEEVKPAGTVTGYKYTTGAGDEVETYDAAGRLLLVTNRQGLTVTLTYADVIEIKDAVFQAVRMYDNTQGNPPPAGLGYTPKTCSAPQGWVYQYKPDNVTAVTYPAKGLLLCVADPFDRQSVYQYDSASRAIKITDSAQQSYTFEYDGASGGCASPGDGGCNKNNLTKVTFPGPSPQKFRLYHYNEAANINGGTECPGMTWSGGLGHLPNHLTGLTDENGVRFSTWKYDCEGRGVSSELAGGFNRVTLAYGTPGADQTTTTHAIGNPADPLTATLVFGFVTRQGVSKGDSIVDPATSQPTPCLGCGDAGTLAYDSNGNVAARIDFRGNKTCYAYDDTGRNLETKRIEGSLPTRTAPPFSQQHPQR
jgi:YD repeat-containing protein